VVAAAVFVDPSTALRRREVFGVTGEFVVFMTV